jgi:hypothetical protein
MKIFKKISEKDINTLLELFSKTQTIATDVFQLNFHIKYQSGKPIEIKCSDVEWEEILKMIVDPYKYDPYCEASEFIPITTPGTARNITWQLMMDYEEYLGKIISKYKIPYDQTFKLKPYIEKLWKKQSTLVK